MQHLQTPPHLTGITEFVSEENDNLLTLRLRCPCGCTGFRLERSCFSAAEEAEIAAWEAEEARARKGCFMRLRKDEKGLLVMMVKRGLFGKWQRYDDCMPPAPYYMDIRVLRATCKRCGAVHTVFDSRYHGEEACLGEYGEAAFRWQHGWQEIPVPEDARELQVELWYYLDEEDLAKFCPAGTDYANTFGGLGISSVDEYERLELIFDWDTD